MSYRGGVRYRSLGVNEHLDMEIDIPAVTHSIPVLLEVAAKAGVTGPMFEEFENMLAVCWNQFESLGDISVNIADYLIVVHTRHQDNASFQIFVVIVPTGVVITSVVTGADSKNSVVMHTPEDWKDFVYVLRGFPTNTTRRIRSVFGSFV